MSKIQISTQSAPLPSGTYSQAIQSGSTVYLAGQIPLDPQTMQLVSDDFAAQAKQVFMNLRQVCKAAGVDLGAIVKLNIYLMDLTHFPMVNETMKQFFQEPYPARTTVQVAALPQNALIEIDAVMVL